MLRAGRDLGDHPISSPYHGQRHPLQGQACQGLILVLNITGVGFISNISGQPVSHHPHCKEFLPRIQPKFPLFQSVPILPCPVATVPEEKSLSDLPADPLHSCVKSVGQKKKHSLPISAKMSRILLVIAQPHPCVES